MAQDNIWPYFYMKYCSRCKVLKELYNFGKDNGKKDGLVCHCKECSKAIRKENAIKIKQFGAIYRASHKEEAAKYSKTYRKNNNSALRLKKKEYYQKNRVKLLGEMNKYRKENQEKINNYRRQRRKIDPSFRMAELLRTRINKLIRRGHKPGSPVRDLGCSLDELKSYLESKFLQGMSWDNYGEWHIDHIILLASFNLEDREQFLKACHYTNLQPLWAIDNLRKGDRV